MSIKIKNRFSNDKVIICRKYINEKGVATHRFYLFNALKFTMMTEHGVLISKTFKINSKTILVGFYTFIIDFKLFIDI